jgi:phosphate:Na+ symporter
MTPFIGYLSWLCEHIIPARKAPTSTVLLEKHLLSTPPLALFCAMRALATMTDIAWAAASAALRGHHLGRPVKIADIEKIEDEVDRYQVEIMAYLVQLTRRNLTLKQAEAIPVLMHCVNDAERISDLALIIARRSATQAEQCVNFSDDAQQELENLLDKAFAVANLTHESLQDGRFLAKTVEAMVLDLKKMAADATQMHVNRLQKGLCTPERGLIYVEVISALMHIVRHLENIAQRSDQLTEAAT